MAGRTGRRGTAGEGVAPGGKQAGRAPSISKCPWEDSRGMAYSAKRELQILQSMIYNSCKL